MSYEGYSQCLCANGHLLEIDAYDGYLCPETKKCHCGADFIFRHAVDTTNDLGVRYPFRLSSIKSCECCGTLLEAKYIKDAETDQQFESIIKAERLHEDEP